MHWLNGLEYDTACARLEDNGYTRIAEGDWAYVYQSPDPTRVVRITPYDPAYLLFVQTCWIFPHKNLPAHQIIVRLAEHGYAVEMPRYEKGDIAIRKNFTDSLKETMEAKSGEDFPLNSLSQILHRGIAAGKAMIPYFFGMDWNVDNVMLDGTTPKLVDGFYQEGRRIYEGIQQRESLGLTEAEIEGFLKLPCLRRPSYT